MQYRPLGKTGIAVSVISFGTIKFGDIPEETAAAAVRRALELGVNFFDSARVYGDSESKLGNALRGRKETFYVSTKSYGRTADQLRKDFEISLRELGLERVDLYNLHSVSDPAAWEMVMAKDGALNGIRRLQNEGLVAHAGLSVHRDLTVMRKAILSGEFETLMVAYNVIDQENVEREILPLAREHGIGVIVMKPLAGGLLASAAAKPGVPVPDDPISLPNLRYVISNPAVSCAIPGIMSAAEIEQDVTVADRTEPLSEAERAALLELIGKQRKEFRYGQVCLRCGYCMEACPEGIRIPDVFRALDAYRGFTEETRRIGLDLYRSLDPKPDACRECGQCMERCPAGIRIPEKLEEARSLFEQAGA